MPRGSGSSLYIAQGVHGIEVKAATQKDSAIDKLFCSNFERTPEVRYNSASNKFATYYAVAAIKPRCRLRHSTAAACPKHIFILFSNALRLPQ